jgi:hypothetical protein
VNGAFTPTGEQQAILDAFAEDGNMVIGARAGTGKTATLKLLAEATAKRGKYIAYNRAPVDEARSKFPKNVECVTAHKLAYDGGGKRFRARLDAERVPLAKAARILRINYPLTFDDKVLQPAQTARLAMETVERFCHSADPEPTIWHVPTVTGLETDAQKHAVQKAIFPLAERVWADLQHEDGGHFRFTPDHFLKIWALKNPVIPGDFALYDEAQDADRVMLGVMLRQGMKVVAVGDPCQAIYAWRGAVDALDRFDAKNRLYLSQSFRFGPAVADEANVWLTLLGADPLVKGLDQIRSTVGEVALPRAILHRTNGGAMSSVMGQMAQRRRVYLVGGGKDIQRFAEAAIDLKAGRGTTHPELCAFTTWGQVQEYVEEAHDGKELKVSVDLIDRYGPDTIIATVQRLAWKPERADVTVATAHKTKGLEFESVLCGGDFHEPEQTEDGELGELSREEMQLNYVAVTRAQHALDLGGLAWGRKYLPDTVSSCA